MVTGRAWTASLLLGGMLMTPPAIAHAQDSPRLAVAGAGGVALPLHADMDFTAPEWQLSLRAHVSRRIAIEGFYDEWRESSTLEQVDVPIFGPDGIIGRAGRISYRNRHVARTLGIAGLVTGTFGRVTVSGGGGPGWIEYERVSRTRAQDCQPVLDFCVSEHRSGSSNGSFSLHGLARTEVLLGSRVGLFGQFQTSIPTRDAGSTHLSLTGGIRVTVLPGGSVRQ